MATTNYAAKRWCFTLNNPMIDETELTDILEDKGVEYLVFQLEEGENGTPHFQGFVCFSEKRRLTQIRHFVPGAPHWEVARGTVAQNRKYCTKEEGRIGDFCEIGTPPPEERARTDLTEIHLKLKAGTLTSKDFANEHFGVWINHPNLVSNYLQSQIEGRKNGCDFSCTLLVGIAGSGKSFYAAKLAKQLGFGEPYRKPVGQWWDGYGGDRAVIFDDFRGNSLSLTDFKLVLDRYALRVQVKGSSCELAATHFFITSNINPLDWWREEIATREADAITRRITKVLCFEEKHKFMEFPDYATYASLILTPLRDGQVRPALPPTQEIVFD